MGFLISVGQWICIDQLLTNSLVVMDLLWKTVLRFWSAPVDLFLDFSDLKLHNRLLFVSLERKVSRGKAIKLERYTGNGQCRFPPQMTTTMKYSAINIKNYKYQQQITTHFMNCELCKVTGQNRPHCKEHCHSGLGSIRLIDYSF